MPADIFQLAQNVNTISFSKQNSRDCKRLGNVKRRSLSDRQEFCEFRRVSLNTTTRDCAMDRERVVASIVALLFLIVAIRKA